MTRYMTIDEVCDRYGWTKKQVHDKTRADAMPFLKRAGCRSLLFNPDHLDAWDDLAPLETVIGEDGSKLTRPRVQPERAGALPTHEREAA